MVNFVVCQDFGLEFFAKAKALRPRPQSKGQPIAMPRPQNLACHYVNIFGSFSCPGLPGRVRVALDYLDVCDMQRKYVALVLLRVLGVIGKRYR